MVEDPTYLGATIVVAQALCLSIFNLSPTQKTCLFTHGNKANVSEKRSFQILKCEKVSVQYSSKYERVYVKK